MSQDKKLLVIPAVVRSTLTLALKKDWHQLVASTPVRDDPNFVGLFCKDDEGSAFVSMTPDQAEMLGKWLVITAERLRGAVLPPGGSLNVDDLERATEAEGSMTVAAGPWISVMEREPARATVVLGRWADGAIRVVEWAPKEYEGKPEGGHRPGDGPVPFKIWLAHTHGYVAGLRTWPTHWAELYPPSGEPERTRT